MPIVKYIDDRGRYLPYVREEGRLFYHNHSLRVLNGTPAPSSMDDMIKVYVKTGRWRQEVWKNATVRV